MPMPRPPPKRFLHDNPEALGEYCLVSTRDKKPCVSCAQIHLPYQVHFRSYRSLQAWKEEFPDPEETPATYARSLSLDCADLVGLADIRWIQSFANVERLDLWSSGGPRMRSRPADSFVLFRGLSPTLKWLSISWNELPLKEIFDLIRSFPLLESLHVAGSGRIRGDPEAISQYPLEQLPVMTGTLVFEHQGVDLLYTLSKLPNRCRFREIEQKQWGTFDHFNGMKALVGVCSDTLEYLTLIDRTSAKSCPFGPSDELST
jgi:hypothetical protein